MATATTAEFHKGMYVLFKEEPHQIVEFKHVNPGKGSAFVRTRLKSVKTGRVQEFTYKSGETVEQLAVETRDMQFLYREGENFVFMDTVTYEQYSVSTALIGSASDYIGPETVCQVQVYEGVAIGIKLPKRMTLTVTEAAEGVKGDSATGATKVVTVETGARITVPLFIREGDKVVVDPQSGSYLERA